MDALAQLRNSYPSFPDMIRGKRVVDYGCGAGLQTVALVREGATVVLAVDSSEAMRGLAQCRVRAEGLIEQIRVVGEPSSVDEGQYDLVISQNSMEHFARPRREMQRMCRLLADDGLLLVTFGPPWYSPYGAHLRYMTALPWVQLIFSEETIMKVRARFRGDGARRFADIPGGLNQMTLGRFQRLAVRSGLVILQQATTYAFGCKGLARVPCLRELLAYETAAVLKKMR